MWAMLEISQSEFHISKQEFLFRWTLPQIAMLVDTRLERDERGKPENQNKQGKPMTMEDYMREMD